MDTQVKVIRRRKRADVVESDVEAGYVKNKDLKQEALLAKLAARKANVSRAERLACDFQFIKNKPMPELRTLYPEKPWRWRCDWFFPFAVGGPLYLDEPLTLADEAGLVDKKHFMQMLGLRYVVLGVGRTEAEDEQELLACGQLQPQQ